MYWILSCPATGRQECDGTFVPMPHSPSRTSMTHISHINPAGLTAISNGDARCSRIAEHSSYHEC